MEKYNVTLKKRLQQLFVYFARVKFCLGVTGWLRLVLVALPGLFCYYFSQSFTTYYCDEYRFASALLISWFILFNVSIWLETEDNVTFVILFPVSFSIQSKNILSLFCYGIFYYGIVAEKTTTFEPPHDKTNKMTVRPAKTQISLGIRPVWSESSLSTRRKHGSLATHWAHSEDSDQTGRMPRLIWVFAGRTVILLVLSWESSLSAWRKHGSLATHWAHSKDSDQTGRMLVILLVLSWGGSF